MHQGRHGRSREAFTLLEVLIALAISVLIWGAVAGALNTVTRMEVDATRHRRANLVAWSIFVAGTDDTKPLPVFADWRAERAPVSQSEPDWEAWRIRPAGAPGAAYRIYLLRTP